MTVAAGDGGFDLGLYYASHGGRAVAVRGTVGGCPGCEWHVTPACQGNDPRTPADGSRELDCLGARISCPRGALVRVWLRRPARSWRPVDSFCLARGARVSTLRDLAPEVGALFRRMPLPAPRLQVQPRRRALVGMPVVAFARPERVHHIRAAVSGFSVTVTAQATSWSWRFGDGATLVSGTPGRPYPHADVTHTFTAPGATGVSVACRWHATYIVAGSAGRIPVPGAVERRTRLPLAVVEAHAELVASP